MPLSRNRRDRSGRRVARAIEPVRTARRGTNKLYLIASIVIAILVIASFAFASFSGGQGGPARVDLGSANGYVGGVGVQHEIMSTKDHLDEGLLEYNSAPPTSGDHRSVPGSCGFYDFEVPDEVIVHNLEHSNIVVSYNLTSQDEIESLRDIFDGLGGRTDQFGVARTYSKIGPGQVALSAWGVSDVMDGVDKDRIERFFDAYVGKLGPEGPIPCLGAQQSMPDS